MDPRPGDPVEPFDGPAAFDRWLAAHHATATVVWIKAAKKGKGIPSISWNEGVDVALCWGWIDGQSKGIDETWFLQRYTPRGPRSRWSKINCERVSRLIAEGRMQPAGLAEVDRARADGRWDAAYDSPSTATVPDDLAAAFAGEPALKAAFQALDGANRYAILHRLQEAKRPETRLRRLARFVEMLRAGGRIHN